MAIERIAKMGMTKKKHAIKSKTNAKITRVQMMYAAIGSFISHAIRVGAIMPLFIIVTKTIFSSV